MPTGKKEKTPKKKGAEQSYWIKSEKDDDIFIPRMYLDQQIEVNSIPRVLTRQSTLIVATCFVEKASAPNYIQTNQQYMFLHPDTILLCGFSVVQLLSIHNPSSHFQSVVCKLLPSNQLEPSRVAVSSTVIRNCQVTYGDHVKVTSFNTSSPVAGVLHLEPCHTINFPISTEFKSYLVSQLDGSIVSNGYEFQVEYMGHVSWFKVTSLVPAGGCHDSLVADLSNLSLNSEMEEEAAADNVQTTCDVDSSFFIVTLRSQVVIQRMHPRSAVSLDSIRGMEKQVKILNEIVLLPLSAPDAFKKKSIRLPRGVLLHGPTGVGKSLLAEAVANKSGAQVISITSQPALLCIEAVHSGIAPTVILIDPLDTVCPRLDQTSSDSDRQAVTSLTNLFDHINKVKCVIVIATTSRLDVVEPSLRRPGRFDKEVEVTVPNPLERKQILEFCFKDISHSLSEADIRSVADAAHGHVRADLVQVCSEAQCKALSRTLQNEEWKECLLDEFCVNNNDVWAALRETRPSAMREVTIEVPKVLWSDIGGQEHIKQKFKESVEWPLKHPEAFSELGIEPPKGVLLYGPPGCSKTMIARALATESGLNFISVKVCVFTILLKLFTRAQSYLANMSEILSELLDRYLTGLEHQLLRLCSLMKLMH
ncbi:ATPase family gene 2 protein homolog A-like isoform X2 [Dysidea avara]|uniref:ATPase family gene 2 protein homolog A-like isoform X2 n=1 Tax=Dysidea avara TaxID=196820 RepID=UPI0033210086